MELALLKIIFEPREKRGSHQKINHPFRLFAPKIFTDMSRTLTIYTADLRDDDFFYFFNYYLRFDSHLQTKSLAALW